MLKVWNASLILGSGTLAILGTFLVRSGVLDSIHAFGASTLGVPFVLLIAAMVIGSVGLIVWRRERAALRGPARLAALPRGGVPVPEPRAGGDGVRDLLGHVLPADLPGAHRHEGLGRAAGVPAVHRARSRWCSCCWRASARSSPGAGRRWPTCGATSRFPAARAVWSTLVVAARGHRRARARPFALLMFALGAFVIAGVVQELWRGVGARRAMTRELAAAGARSRWSGATAAATAATSCTPAWPCC